MTALKTECVIELSLTVSKASSSVLWNLYIPGCDQMHKKQNVQ